MSVRLKHQLQIGCTNPGGPTMEAGFTVIGICMSGEAAQRHVSDTARVNQLHTCWNQHLSAVAMPRMMSPYALEASVVALE